jgi:hypothetical protein
MENRNIEMGTIKTAVYVIVDDNGNMLNEIRKKPCSKEQPWTNRLHIYSTMEEAMLEKVSLIEYLDNEYKEWHEYYNDARTDKWKNHCISRIIENRRRKEQIEKCKIEKRYLFNL